MEAYPKTAQEVQQAGQRIRKRFNFHTCTFTCFKHGRHTCRMAYKRMQSTTFFIKELFENPDNYSGGKPIVNTRGIDPPVQNSKHTIGYKDSRALVFGLRRPTEKDQSLVESNNLLASLLRCNTNCQVQLTDVQAKYSIYYIGNYMSKNPVELGNLFSVIYAAVQDARKQKSTATDSGSPLRNAKFLLEKFLTD